MVRTRLLILGVIATAALAAVSACSDKTGGTGTGGGNDADQTIIRVTGSDTMVNLAQAWAEEYKGVNPGVSVQVAGGGSGVGIAGLIDGIVDIANTSRAFKSKEIQRAKAKHDGVEPVKTIVGLDALAVYVHRNNPMTEISIAELADIYGEGGTTETWSQLGASMKGCSSDEIVRVSRQNNSGTYYYFREAIVGKERELKLGSLDQSGSKDVVALVGGTPCAIGYSGMAYATPDVKMLAVSKEKGGPAAPPTKEAAGAGTYPIARPLFIYTIGEPKGIVKDYIDWILSPAGQKIVNDIGYVPVK